MRSRLLHAGQMAARRQQRHSAQHGRHRGAGSAGRGLHKRPAACWRELRFGCLEHAPNTDHQNKRGSTESDLVQNCARGRACMGPCQHHLGASQGLSRPLHSISVGATLVETPQWVSRGRGGSRDDLLRSQGAGDAAALWGQPSLVGCWSWLPGRRGQEAAWPCHARRAGTGRPAAGQQLVLKAWAWQRRSSAAWGQGAAADGGPFPAATAPAVLQQTFCVRVCGADLYTPACVLFAAKVKAHELRGQSKSELQQQVR